MKLQLIRNYYVGRNEPTEWKRLVDSHRSSELGWSFVAAILCLVLDALAAYLYVVSGKELRERRKHLLRRRQLQLALMNSCRQDVAFAFRAKLTVETDDND